MPRELITAAVLGITIICGFLLAADVWPARPATGWTTGARIVRVIDGDTLEVEVRKTIRVRLLDCWAPESRTTNAAEKARGLKAKAELQRLAPVDAECLLHIPTKGGDLSSVFTLGRVLGRVWMDSDAEGVSLSQRMVDGGWAAKEKP